MDIKVEEERNYKITLNIDALINEKIEQLRASGVLKSSDVVKINRTVEIVDDGNPVIDIVDLTWSRKNGVVK